MSRFVVVVKERQVEKDDIVLNPSGTAISKLPTEYGYIGTYGVANTGFRRDAVSLFTYMLSLPSLGLVTTYGCHLILPHGLILETIIWPRREPDTYHQHQFNLSLHTFR